MQRFIITLLLAIWSLVLEPIAYVGTTPVSPPEVIYIQLAYPPSGKLPEQKSRKSY